MIKPLIHGFFSSCFCPILLFLHALFPSEDRLAFQQSELAGGCSNCSMSVFFLSFSGIFKACDTLFLFSWPTVLCQQGSICGSRGTRCSSQGASLKGQRRTSGLSAVDRVPSVRPVLCVQETAPVVPHCSGTSIPFQMHLALVGQMHISQGNENKSLQTLAGGGFRKERVRTAFLLFQHLFWRDWNTLSPLLNHEEQGWPEFGLLVTGLFLRPSNSSLDAW